MKTKTKEENKLTITAKAVSKIKEFMKEDNNKNSVLRLGIVESGGCCRGIQYLLEFTNSPMQNETIINSQGIKIFIDKIELSSIAGFKIDYIKDEHGEGFKIEAEAKESGGSGGCGSEEGCGSSDCGSGGCGCSH